MVRLTQQKSVHLQRFLLSVGLLLVVMLGTQFAQVLHGLAPDITGAGYRLFATSNTTTPGTPLAATNTPAQLTTAGQTFRLRTGLTTRPDS
jgi:hypothetical protein